MRIALLILLSLGFCDTNYFHDLWDTQPKSIIRDYEAFRSSFFGIDDVHKYNSATYWKVPLWVSYQVKAYSGRPPNYPRPAIWTTDEVLYRLGIATTEKPYRNSGYDRGHMCMKEIASRISAKADYETHSMINALAQIHQFNAGIWLDLEIHTMRWADTYGDVWVICGPVFSNRAPSKFIGNTSIGFIAVPDFCYKIVIKTNPSFDVLAFMYPNTSNYTRPFNHSNYSLSVLDIEKLTGLTFIHETAWYKEETNFNIWK